MNLYNLTGNFLAVQKMIDDSENDSTFNSQTLVDTLESIECAIEVKAQNTVYLIKNIEGYSNTLANEIERLQAKKKAIDSNVERLKSFLFGQLELVGMTEIKTPIATIKQRLNPHSVIIEDEKLVPAKFCTIIPESYKPNKVDIKNAMKNGEEVAGCKLVQNKSWEIK